jgi:hypothetical protein
LDDGERDILCGSNVDRLGYEWSFVALLQLAAIFQQMNSTFCLVLMIDRYEKAT